MTGIKSIFEEMIDTGSQVSEILQNKTGKSFTELMNSGKTLTDVLSIIQEEAESSGKSFTELWGSENAGRLYAWAYRNICVESTKIGHSYCEITGKRD